VREDQEREVDMTMCRVTSCPETPVMMGIWRWGTEKGLWIPYCEQHRIDRNMTDCQPWRWPIRTAEEAEAEFWKELNS
jgi:hypothetical protein